MPPPASLSYEINAADQLIRLSETWMDFARENDGEALTPEQVLGGTLWDFIADPTIHDIYQRLTRLARNGRPSRFRYRCDSARHKRWFEMHVRGRSEGRVEFESVLLQEHERPENRLFTRKPADNRLLVRVCSWCHAIAWPGESWTPLDAAAERVIELDETEVPALTHGICEPCASGMLAQIAHA